MLSIQRNPKKKNSSIIVHLIYEDKFKSSGDAASYDIRELSNLADYPKDDNGKNIGFFIIPIFRTYTESRVHFYSG